MALLSSFVQSRQRELRSGVSNLSLNTPCLSYLSMCLSHQRDENSEKVALPNASRMDQQRRSILKLSIMLRELAHLCLLEPKASRKKNKATKQQQQQQQQQQQIEQENRKEEEFLYCDISIFPTLRVLEARGVHPKQLVHLDSLRSTLEVLSIENANITSPSQVLSSSGGTDNFTPWSNLTNVRLSKCGMVVLDASVSLLSAAVVIQFNDNSLHDVSIGLSVLPRLQRLQHLDLSFNRISSLVGFSHSALEPQEYCKMQTLVLRHNKLTSTEGLGVLVKGERSNVASETSNETKENEKDVNKSMSQNNISPVDVENYNEKEYPLFSAALFTEYILKPGDTLFIPDGCWHYVRSLSCSFSLNFWF